MQTFQTGQTYSTRSACDQAVDAAQAQDAAAEHEAIPVGEATESDFGEFLAVLQ